MLLSFPFQIPNSATPLAIGVPGYGFCIDPVDWYCSGKPVTLEYSEMNGSGAHRIIVFDQGWHAIPEGFRSLRVATGNLKSGVSEGNTAGDRWVVTIGTDKADAISKAGSRMPALVKNLASGDGGSFDVNPYDALVDYVNSVSEGFDICKVSIVPDNAAAIITAGTLRLWYRNGSTTVGERPDGEISDFTNPWQNTEITYDLATALKGPRTIEFDCPPWGYLFPQVTGVELDSVASTAYTVSMGAIRKGTR